MESIDTERAKYIVADLKAIADSPVRFTDNFIHATLARGLAILLERLLGAEFK